MGRLPILFLNVLIIATCGLIYELLAGTVASYVLGDSVTQFSLVIGLYLAALGIGAFLSRFITQNLPRRFVEIELAVALVGGCSAPALFLSFAHSKIFSLVLYGEVLTIGTLVGLEIPLLMRIIEKELEFKDLVSKVLTFDYIGSLAASILFPLLLVPHLGLVRTSLAFGLLNASVGLWASFLLRDLIPGSVLALRLRGVGVAALLVAGLIYADQLTRLSEENLYADEIIYSKSTPYQRIVVTQGRAGFNLFLNGHLQFSSADEYRYHESLVHPALLTHGSPRRVLILGGGDGLALREVLKYASVAHVTLVDIDPEMTRLSHRFDLLSAANRRAFEDARVEVVNQDAMRWLEQPGPAFDCALIDFPDPNAFSLGKLYTKRFYRLLQLRLDGQATVAVQCTSPLFARKSYWCIIRTLEAAGFCVKPYHAAVPSFGEWGFALARLRPFDLPQQLPEDLHCRFLDEQTLAALFVFSADMQPVAVEINRLDNQALVRYYEQDWRRWE